MKKSVYLLLFICLLTGLCFAPNVTIAADSIELKAITFLPRNHPIVNPNAEERRLLLLNALSARLFYRQPADAGLLQEKQKGADDLSARGAHAVEGDVEVGKRDVVWLPLGHNRHEGNPPGF